MSARAEDAARALSREQPTTADAAVPAPANNGSADAEGVEIPAPEPSGNKNLLSVLVSFRGSTMAHVQVGQGETVAPAIHVDVVRSWSDFDLRSAICRREIATTTRTRRFHCSSDSKLPVCEGVEMEV